LNRNEVTSIVVECIHQLNRSRREADRIVPTLDAPLFGEGSSLDSIGLVSLVLDLEDSFQACGYELSLSDSRAMSRRQSPYRTVQSLIDFIIETMPQDRHCEAVQWHLHPE
jgi:acyl carrier protein